MELRAKLAHKAISVFLHGAVVQSYLAGLFLKLLHGAVLQKLPYKAIS